MSARQQNAGPRGKGWTPHPAIGTVIRNNGDYARALLCFYHSTTTGWGSIPKTQPAIYLTMLFNTIILMIGTVKTGPCILEAAMIFKD